MADPFAQYAAQDDDPFAAYAAPAPAKKAPYTGADVDAWTAHPPSLREVAGNVPEAALNVALSELGGQAASWGLRTVGKGLYRAAALPLLGMVNKYGDPVQKGLEAGVAVTKRGFAKAGEQVTAAQAAKQAAVSAADAKGSILTKTVVDNATGKLGVEADNLRRVGLPDPSAGMAARGGRILTANGPGMAPSAAEGMKHTLDDQLGGAYKKLRMKEPVSASERMNMALSQELGASQEALIPGYREMNRGVMDAVGVQKMVGRRLAGANQQLENIVTAAIGPAALPARMLLLPGVASNLGIGAYRAGQHPQVPANLLRAALLQMMGGADQEP